MGLRNDVVGWGKEGAVREGMRISMEERNWSK